MFSNSNMVTKKKKKQGLGPTLPISSLDKSQAQKSLKLLKVTLDCGFKFQELAKNVASKAKKKVMRITGKLGSV